MSSRNGGSGGGSGSEGSGDSGGVVSTCTPVPNVAPENLTARMVVENPEVYLKAFLKHWESSLPDLTDVPAFAPEQLSFWVRHHKSKKKNPEK